MNKKIAFSPPDITQKEIDEVIDSLKSGWITTGSKVKLFEKEIASYCGTPNAMCLNSATAAMELVLRLFDIGYGDEVITTPYTYTASASVILHCGAKPVFVDIENDGFNIDVEKLACAITEKTKAIICVDVAGFPADIDALYKIIESKKNIFCAQKQTYQEQLGRILLISDAAHSFGALYKDLKVGAVADFTCFSFHAVKNLTTAEGGAITWKKESCFDSSALYRSFMLLALHGQTKDAFSKMQAGSWEYDIELLGYKYNLTDIHASIGLAQLRRYDTEIMPARKKAFMRYEENLSPHDVLVLPTYVRGAVESSCHLYLLKIPHINLEQRNCIIQKMAEQNIATNVHYKPLPLMTAYKKLGYDIADYPLSFKTYECEISLPLHSLLTESDVDCVCDTLVSIMRELQCI